MFLDAERKDNRKYMLYHQDGLLDIFVGLVIVLAGASLLGEMFWMTGAWVAIFAPLWISARRSITYPRVPEPEAVPTQNFTYLLIFLLLIGVLVLSLTVGLTFMVGFERVPALRAFLDSNLLLVLGAGQAAMLLIPAIFMRVHRFYAYAALTLAVYALAQLLGWAFWTATILAGVVMALCGMLVLLRFLQKPKLQDLQ